MNLIKSFFSISGFTFLSRVIGFLRDMVITQYFGANKITDAFWVAFRIPNLLRRIFAEGAFSQAFIPILSDFKKNRSKEEAILFSREVAGLLSLALFVATIIGILASRPIILLIASGFAHDPQQFSQASNFLKITFPYIFFISLTSFFSAILNTYQRFSVPAITPVFLNITLIFFSIVVSPYFKQPVSALAWGVFFAGLIQLLFQLPFVSQLGFLQVPKLNVRDSKIRKVVQAMALIIIGVSSGQISIILNGIYASYLEKGSITWQYISDRIMELPSSLLGVALGTVLLPTLATYTSKQDEQAFSKLLDWGLRLAFTLALPAAAGISVLAMPLITTLFQHGKFTLYDVNMTYPAVIAYSLAIPGFIFIKVLAPGFTSRQDYKTPVLIGFFTLLLTQFLNLWLVLYFQLGIVGINLSISIAACANSLLLLYLLRRKGYYQPQPAWFSLLCKITLATIIMTGTLYALLTQHIYPLYWQGSNSSRVIQLMALMVIGVVEYAIILLLFGFKTSFLSIHYARH